MQFTYHPYKRASTFHSSSFESSQATPSWYKSHIRTKYSILHSSIVILLLNEKYRSISSIFECIHCQKSQALYDDINVNDGNYKTLVNSEK
jgi:hypothetical protein